jgi:hypothetical protein
LPHQQALEKHLRHEQGTLFQLDYDLLLYDITSTYFEGQAEDNDRARRGYRWYGQLLGDDGVKAPPSISQTDRVLPAHTPRHFWHTAGSGILLKMKARKRGTAGIIMTFVHELDVRLAGQSNSG